MEKLPALSKKFANLLKLEKIEEHHLQVLNAARRKEFINLLYDKLHTLEGSERDTFLEKTTAVLNNESISEYHYTKIRQAMDDVLKKTGCFPTVALLAQHTGLSRKTVTKHVKNFKESDEWQNQKDMIDVAVPGIMSMLAYAALKGNVSAAKTYLSTTKSLAHSQSSVSNQNNFVQINNTIINQQAIQQLKPEQRQKIEQLFSGSEQNKEPVEPET